MELLWENGRLKAAFYAVVERENRRNGGAITKTPVATLGASSVLLPNVLSLVQWARIALFVTWAKQHRI